jgi:uncharacterized damage-inducible protein DinB
MPNALIERPVPGEASAEAFNYINLVPAGDVLALLKRQRDEARALFAGTSDEKSLYRYAAGKWSIRDMVNHMSDAERIFSYRALWFARALPHRLPDFDQEIAAPSAEADRVPWAALAEEFDRVRAATISFFDNLPAAAWQRKGIASGNSISVRALAYVIAGHVIHHVGVLRDKYL